MGGPFAIGVDLGATNLKGASVDRAGGIVARYTCPLGDTGPGAVIADMVRLVDRLLDEGSVGRSDFVGVGVGAPGPMNVREGRILRAPNLDGWVNVPLRDELARRLRVPVILENDGNAAAFGEYWVGAGRDGRDLVMLTLGTGVGAGVVLGGRVLHGHFDNAAELGHGIVVVDGLPCPCGQRGCLEQYASAAGVARRVRAAIDRGEPSMIVESLDEALSIDAEAVARCAAAGDALCLRVWDEACLYLAVTCINIQHAFNPARVVLGGGMSRAGAFLVDRVVNFVERHRWNVDDDVPAISLAELGYDAGVIGAAGLVLTQT